MFFFLSKLLDLVLSPLTWVLVLLLFAVPWTRRRARRWRRGRALTLGALALLLLFSIEPVANAILYSMEHDAPSTYRPDATYDVIVLLGGVTDEDVTDENGQPAYNENVERVLMTHRLLRDGKARFVIASGGSGEGALLAEQIRDWGIEPERIVVEGDARNTREIAVYSAAIVKQRGWKKVLLVTSAFHMKRALGCFVAAGLHPDTRSTDFHEYSSRYSLSWQPRANHLSGSTGALREYVGRMVYELRGYTR